MRLNWLGTTAVALLIGTGAVIAQSQDTPQKREEGPRAQTPKDADRPAAREQRSRDGMKDRTAQPEPKGAKEPQRGEAPAERKQAQEPARDTKQPAQQGQERRERTSPTQQTQERQQGRDAKQPDTKQQQGRQPADTKQQQGQTTPPSTTSQPATTSPTAPMRQDARPGDRQQGQTTGQARDSTRTGTSSLQVDDQQRTQIVDRLRRERTATQNINIDVRVGQRLPARVRPLPLPRDIVRIAPQYRGYSYIVVQEQIYIVSPRTREVVDIIYEPGSARTAVRSERVMITREQRDTLRQAARRMTTAPTSGSASATLDQSCLTLQPVPEELVRANPEFGSYRYLAIGEQVILLDPRQQKIVEVID